jgi:hypothetical protein
MTKSHHLAHTHIHGSRRQPQVIVTALGIGHRVPKHVQRAKEENDGMQNTFGQVKKQNFQIEIFKSLASFVQGREFQSIFLEPEKQKSEVRERGSSKCE